MKVKARSLELLRDPSLLTIFTVTLVAVMGTSSITPALPAVVRAFGISTVEAGWLVAAFAMPGIVLSPVAGMLADRVGRKWVLVPSLLIFAVAGHACAYATGFGELLTFRILQGVSAASLGALNATLIGDLYRGNERTAAMGYNGGVASAAAAGYPLIGGALALFGWRYPFALPLIAIPIALLIAWGLRNPEPHRLDSFFAYVAKVAAGLRKAAVLSMFFAGFVAFSLLYGAKLTFLPFLLEDRFAATSMEIGLVFGISALGSVAGSVALGATARRVRSPTILVAAFSAMAIALAGIPFASAEWLIVAWSAIFGMGHGIGVSMSMALLADSAPAEQRGAIMALNGTMFRLGQTAGPLIMGGLHLIGGMDAVFIGSGALALSAALLLGWLIGTR